MKFWISVWKRQDWKLSIARISFTEISNEFCLPVSHETGSSEAVKAKKMLYVEQEIQEIFGFHSSEPTKMEVVHCKNFIHRDIKRILPPSIS